MEESAHQTLTLDLPESEEIPTKEETPLPHPIEIENPHANPLQSDQNPGGNSEIEDPLIPKALEKCTQDGGEIEGADLSKTLENSSQAGIEVANRSKTLEKSSQKEIQVACLPETLENYPKDENPDGFSPDRNKSHISSIFGPLTENEPCPVGAGLANLGNTCFLNAIMQCFTHTVPLVQGLQSFKHESSNHGYGDYCVLCAVRGQIEHSLAYSGRVISPSNLVDNLSHISSFFRRYQQEDAHEFLQCLLDNLDSNWSKYEANANDSSLSEDSLVKQVFGGRLVSQLHCSKCGHNSHTYEPLIDLSLGIEDADNLESALRSFTKVESIGDTEKFTCESCKEQVTVEKQLMLDQAPSVAALHLKRFKSDGFYVEKIDKKVEYPLELDLKPYIKGVDDRNEELKYELYAVVVHVGMSSTSGHYFSYIRTAPDSWYRFDDSKVSRVLEVTALCQDAYILFYVRKGTAWFSSVIEEWRVSSENKFFNTSPKSVLDDSDLPSTSKSFGPRLHCYEMVGKCKSSEGNSNDEVQIMSAFNTQDSSAANRTTSPSSRGLHHDEETKVVEEADFDAKFSPELSNVGDAMRENGKGETRSINHEACPSSPIVERIINSEAKHGVDINPCTPSRSQSSDIYSDEEPAEVAYRIPLDHLKIEDKAASTAKKSMEKAKHDLKRKEAVKYMSKSMPVGRRQSLMAAMMGSSRTQTSLNNKRKQASFSQSPGKRVKVSPKRMLRLVTA